MYSRFQHQHEQARGGITQEEEHDSPEKVYFFHVLYHNAYTKHETSICTEFGDQVLAKVSAKPNSFYYPHRDLPLGGDVVDTFARVLHSSKKTLLLLSTKDIDGGIEKIFLEKAVTQAVSQKNKVPLETVVLGDFRQRIELVDPIFITGDRNKWVKETGEINSLLYKLFDKTIWEAPIIVPMLESSISKPLDNCHNNTMELVREIDAMLRWMNKYDIKHQSVIDEFNRLGIESKSDLVELHNNMDFFVKEHNFKVNIIKDRKLRQEALPALVNGSHVWRDEYVTKSQEWHLLVTTRLRSENNGEIEIDDLSSFIRALSKEIYHPEERLVILNQQRGSLLVSFLAKCKDWNELFSLHRRCMAKAAKSEEPFLVWKERKVKYFPNRDDPNQLPIISKMIDISEDCCEELFCSTHGKYKSRNIREADPKNKSHIPGKKETRPSERKSDIPGDVRAAPATPGPLKKGGSASQPLQDLTNSLTIIKTDKMIQAVRSDARNLICAATVLDKSWTETQLKAIVWDMQVADLKDQSWIDRELRVNHTMKLEEPPYDADFIAILDNMLLLRVKQDWNSSRVIAVDSSSSLVCKSSEEYPSFGAPGYCCYKCQVLLTDMSSSSITQIDAKELIHLHTWTDERVREPERICSKWNRAAVYDRFSESISVFKFEKDQLSYDMLYTVEFEYCQGMQLLSDGTLMGINQDDQWSVWNEDGVTVHTKAQHPPHMSGMKIYPQIMQDPVSRDCFVQEYGKQEDGTECRVLYNTRMLMSKLKTEYDFEL